MEQEDKSKSLDEQGQETAGRCARSSVDEGNGQDAGLTEDVASDAYMSELGDIGNVDLPDIDLDLLDFLPSDEMEDTRYMLPHVAHYDPTRRPSSSTIMPKSWQESCALQTTCEQTHSSQGRSSSETSSRRS